MAPRFVAWLAITLPLVAVQGLASADEPRTAQAPAVSPKKRADAPDVSSERVLPGKCTHPLATYAVTAPAIETRAIVSAVRGYLTQDFKEAHEALQCLHDRAQLDDARFVAVDGTLSHIEATLAPSYTPEQLRADACYKPASQWRPDAGCSGRLAGFALAAHTLAAGKKCWEPLVDHWPDAFRAGLVDWWAAQAHPDECVPPQRPARCLVALCGGGKDGYAFGLAFRPSVELGVAAGSGFGFFDGASLQFLGTVGARFFFLEDLGDVHVQTGVGASSSLSQEQVPSNKGFWLYAAGLGAWNGLLVVDFVRESQAAVRPGYAVGTGVVIGLDAMAIQRIIRSR